MLIENAHTLSEVEAVQERLHTWISQYPEARERLADVFEQLFLTHESAREAQLEASAMQLSPEARQLREELFALRRRVRAEDPPAVFRPALRAARQSLQAWEATHPEERNGPTCTRYWTPRRVSPTCCMRRRNLISAQRTQ